MVTLFGTLFNIILDFLFVDVLSAPTEDSIEFQSGQTLPINNFQNPTTLKTTSETRIVSPRLSKIHSLATLAVQRESFKFDQNKTHRKFGSTSNSVEEIRKANLSDDSMKGNDLYESLLLDIKDQREHLKKGAERDLFDSSWG